jgi:hypothetical protein
MAEERGFDEIEAEIDADVPDEWAKKYRELGRELKAKREKYGPLEEAFGAIGEGDRKFLAQIGAALQSDPAAAARMFIDASRSIATHESVQADWNELAGITPEEGTPEMDEEALLAKMAELVKETVNSELSGWTEKQKEEAELQRAQRQIADKLKDLGYDPSSREAKLLLLEAKELGGEPLEALDQAHTAITEFLSEKAKSFVSQEPDADASTGLLPDGGATATETHDTSEGATAEERVMERLNALDASPEDVGA